MSLFRIMTVKRNKAVDITGFYGRFFKFTDGQQPKLIRFYTANIKTAMNVAFNQQNQPHT